MLLSHVQDFESVFAKEEFDTLPDYCQQDYTINLISGVKPKFSKVYPLSPAEQSKLDAFLTENLCTG